MEELAQTVIINFVLGLFFGLFPMFLLLRGFLPSFINARLGAGKYLLRLHMPDGFTVRWRVGRLKEGGAVFYKVGKDQFVTTIDAGVVKRSMGVNWVDVEHGETAAYNFRKVVPQEFKDEEGGVYHKLVNFLGWDDSAAVMVVLRTALMQPRKGLALGNIDFKKLLIVGGIIAVAIYVVTKTKNGGSII